MFYKRIFRFLIVSLVLLTININLILADTERYINEKYGFSIIPPIDWEFKDGAPYNLAAIFVGPADLGFRVNFNINILNIPEDEEAVINDELISSIKKELSYVSEELGEIEFQSEGKRDVAGFEGYELVYLIKVVGDIAIKQKQVYFIKDHKFYVFTFSALKDTFDKYLPLFENSLKTFQIL
uniref:PsbP C-terminal domain-containing protein n=1 Tax=Dictyoglomus thermophilum TaxID=14 RepID=A0A7C3MQL9_DICTH